MNQGGVCLTDPVAARSNEITMSEAGGLVAAEGLQVKVDYVGTLDDGSVFDSSEGGQPIAFVVGGGRVIPGMDKGVRGMKVGEKKQLRIEPADAYGSYEPRAVQE